MHLVAFERDHPEHIQALVSIWNAACGADLAINARLVEYNTHLATGSIQAGQIAMNASEAVGFVVTSALPNDPQTSPPHVGWLDAIAVAPNFQQQGIGRDLLNWAEGWLRLHGCTRARLGGSLRPFVPGLPVELGNIAYFKTRGYVEQRDVHDVARDLGKDNLAKVSATRPHSTQDEPSQSLDRPAQPDDADPLLDFFRREFPGRWRFEFEEFQSARGDMTNYQLLVIKNQIHGFARLTFENSERPVERFYMHRLPRPWGQLGPIGVSKDLRGQGHGRALVEASLNYLQERGVRGCVIDWTDLATFYEKFGFTRYRKYAILAKEINPK